MKTLNKSLLAAAVIGVIALPGVSSAAQFTHVVGTQITTARDVFPSQTTILSQVGNTLQVIAQGQERNDLAAAALAGDRVRVRVNFDFVPGSPGIYTTPVATTLVDGFMVGFQGAPTVDSIANHDAAGVLTPNLQGFSNVTGTGAQGIEFVIDYAAGTVIPGPSFGEYFIQFDGLALTNLVARLGDVNGAIVAAVEVYNVTQNKTIITSTNGTIARSVWGLMNDQVSYGFPSGTTATIDVGSQPNRRTRFAPTGIIGESNPVTAAANSFNAGEVVIDITEANVVGGGLARVRHLATPTTDYNVINPTATYTIEVKGDNLSPWGASGPDIWLGTPGNNCSLPDANRALLTVNPSDNTRASTAALPYNHAFFTGLWQPVPFAAYFIVCFGANGTTELFEQTTLSGTVDVKYNNPIVRRVDNPPISFTLNPMPLNGTVMTFQNFNPASNVRAESFLRLTNNNTVDCPVFIDAKDDDGRHAGPVEVLVKAHQSEHFESGTLENGIDSGDPRILSGKFSDGTGKWYLRVTAECNNLIGSSLNRNNNTGTVTDLTPERATGGSTVMWGAPTVKVPGSLP